MTMWGIRSSINRVFPMEIGFLSDLGVWKYAEESGMPLDLARGFRLKCVATATAGAPELPQFVIRQPQKQYSKSFAKTNPVICAPLGEAGSAFANWPWCLKFGFDEITVPEVKHYCASVEATDLQALCNHICLCRLLFGNYFLS